MKRILLVEDEESLIHVLTLNLELENYSVEVARSGSEALSKYSEKIDLIILDIMIPEINGFDVCRKIRTNSNVPILMTSAKGTSTDRIGGLKAGADDYLVKPFNLEELLLRVDILLKRSPPLIEPDSFEFGGNTVNFKTFEVFAKGKKMTLTKREVDLMKMLITRKNQVISRDEILDEIWGKDVWPSSRTIDNYILNLRKYFEMDSRNPMYFKSLRGVGYKFEYNF